MQCFCIRCWYFFCYISFLQFSVTSKHPRSMKTFLTLNCGRKGESSPKYPTCPTQTCECTITVYHKWKPTINSFLLDNKSEMQKSFSYSLQFQSHCNNRKKKKNNFAIKKNKTVLMLCCLHLISQGTETTARWGGAAALWGNFPHPPAAGQRLLWKGEQASMFVLLFTSLSNFYLGTDESNIPACLS